MIDVMNMATGEIRTYSLSPEDAVIAAYAQSRGDWSTWNYGKYRDEVVTGAACVSLGDWGAFRNGRRLSGHRLTQPLNQQRRDERCDDGLLMRP